MERSCDLVEGISDRGNSPREGNISVNSRNLHIPLKTEYTERDHMG